MPPHMAVKTQQRQQVKTSIAEVKAEVGWDSPGELVVYKHFDDGWFRGKVDRFETESGSKDEEKAWPRDKVYAHISYEDGDQEDISLDELADILYSEGHPMWKEGSEGGRTMSAGTSSQRVRARSRKAVESEPLYDVDPSAAPSGGNQMQVDPEFRPEPKAKRQRVDKENIPRDVASEPLLASLGDMLPTPGPAGTIGKVAVKNFMCHSNFAICLGPNVNFVSGENGSGKSAILTGLLVALGVSAKTTRRSDRLDEMVKHGEVNAWIQVVIWNTGEDAYKPAVYGDRIVIERKIGQQKSHLLKAHSGRTCEQGGRAVKAMLEHFSIDVNNPCTILGQDHSREFLGGGASDSAKYKFFMEGTMMQAVQDNLSFVKDQIRMMGDEVTNKREEYKQYETSYIAVKEKLDASHRQIDMKAEVQELEKLAAWAPVKLLEQKVADCRAQLEGKFPEILAKIEAKLEKAAGAVAEATQRRTELDASTTELMGVLQGVKDKQEELTAAKRQAYALVRNATVTLDDINQSVTFQAEKRADLLSTIAEAEERPQEKGDQANFDMMQRLSALEAEQQEEQQATAELVERKRKAKMAIEGVTEAKAKVAGVRQQVQKAERAVKDSESGRGGAGTDAAYATQFGVHPDFVRIFMGHIQSNARRFSRPPLGPLGKHVRVKEGKYAYPVEAAIGKQLDFFVVANAADKKVLQNCFQNAKRDFGKATNASFSCLIANMNSDRVYDVQSRNRLPVGLTTVMSILEVDDPVVMNCLIDQAGIERLVICKDHEEGKRAAWNTPGVKAAYLMDGTELSLKGSTQSTHPLRHDHRLKRGNIPKLAVVHVDQGAYLRQQLEYAQHAVSESQQELQAAEEIREAALAGAKTANGRLKGIKERLTVLQTQYEEAADEVAQATQAAVANAGNSLKVELSEVEAGLAAAEAEVPAAEANLQEATQRRDKLLAEVDECQQQTTEVFARVEVAQAEVAEANQGVLAAQTAVDNLNKKKVMVQNVLTERQTELDENLARLKTDMGQATLFCAPEEVEPEKFQHVSNGFNSFAAGGFTDVTVSEIGKRLESKKRRLERHVEQTGDIDQLTAEEADSRRLMNKMRKKIEKVDMNHQELHEGLARRLDLLKQTNASIAMSISNTFNSYLSRRGHSGTLKVDQENGTLKLQVRMGGGGGGTKVKDTKSMSGGEKSFTTLAFTLALGNETDAPFRAMDEFDVFMDNVNRKVSLDTLMKYAMSHAEAQFIFLTPQDISEVDGKKYPEGFVKVHGIKAARPL